MKLGRFVIDTHVHVQRHAAGPEFKKLGLKDPKKIQYKDLAKVMRAMTTYDNSKRLMYDMECYDVDMCILCSAFGMNNDINVELVEKYPEKFRALAFARETADKAIAGEIEWTMEAAVEELDRLLSTGKFIGVGEGMPSNPGGMTGGKTYTQTDRMDELRLVMDLARKHKVPVRVHSGTPMGYPICYTFWPENWHPNWIRDLAAEYPDVSIIFDHGGMQGGRWDNQVEECIQVAANHDNVYLETGLYWTDLYYKALADPNVGPEKLMWGTDWGASIPVQTQLGMTPQTYAAQVRKDGIVTHQVDVMGWSLKQVSRLDISQDDMNLILAGNALRVYNIDFPVSRMFRIVN
ncbi:MAG: amidohydrolase [Deltaproteobacteria bacterium]|nr:amidohydrolase [Deltaproteobacteria bacterium]MBW2207357.1 amidohydrolase [Deltaproteobacteria bacterium]